MAITKEIKKLKGQGGSGRGQGRHKSSSTLIAQQIRDDMAKALKKRFGPILDAQLDAAEGIRTEYYDKKTGELCYKDPGPDTQAFRNIVDHVIGRAKESLGIENLDDKPFIIKLDR